MYVLESRSDIIICACTRTCTFSIKGVRHIDTYLAYLLLAPRVYNIVSNLLYGLVE